jgi:hypothetical protein
MIVSICLGSKLGPPVAGPEAGALVSGVPLAASASWMAVARRTASPLPAVVHVHDVGGHLVEVVVHRGHVESPLEQAGHHGSHLLVAEHEILKGTLIRDRRSEQ